ncbi:MULTISPECIES: hypothetical protein [unclassified Bradyrhizobium]|uniref:hypothetical protein n=1 Tax=unclassified Bradyrhizobium TaxID=2631580 RepID=UPI001FFAC66F|nr:MULTISPECIES: hypothetical protein [unclassified Bradyrhizobium]MCK1533158.1 hypothetical protein [Bradyrhizobium sp. 176]MCK1558270.1 hypothetical protein [Bradyrhizobium sp. 171]
MLKVKRPKNFADTNQLPREQIMQEIGRIAIVSASIEDLLHALHWEISGLNDLIGPLITSDVKPARLSQDIIKIGKAAKVKQSTIDELRDLFSDYATLAQERNKFVHWIWSWNTKTREDRIDPPGYKHSREGKYVSVQDVADVADDLVWVEHRLQNLVTEFHKRRKTKKV